jgi:hypothetical protein
VAESDCFEVAISLLHDSLAKGEMSVAEATNVVDAILCIVKHNLTAEAYWRLKAELLERLLKLQESSQRPQPHSTGIVAPDGNVRPEPSQDMAEAIGQNEAPYEEESPTWNHIKQWLPKHMQNDPIVQRDIGFVYGLFSEKLIGRLLREIGIIP